MARRGAPMIVGLALAALAHSPLLAPLALHAQPLPPEKPDAVLAPGQTAPTGAVDGRRTTATPRAKPAQRAPQVAAAPAPGKSCLSRLQAAGMTVRAGKPIREGRCGAPAPVIVSAVGNVRFSASATMRCAAAEATLAWVKTAAIPAARQYLGAELAALNVSASYVCRNRRTGRGSTRLSEHGRANAIDISGFGLANGRTVAVAPAKGRPSREARFQKAVRAAACRHFTTVLGPGSDPLHDDHFHFDSAQRRGGYRLCR